MNIDLSNRIVLSDTAPPRAAASKGAKSDEVSGADTVFSKLMMQGLQKSDSGKAKNAQTAGDPANNAQGNGQTMQEAMANPEAMQEADVGQTLELQGTQELLAMYAALAAGGTPENMQIANPFVQTTDEGGAVSSGSAVQLEPMLQATNVSANPQRFISLMGAQADSASVGMTQAGAEQVQPESTGVIAGRNAFRENLNATLTVETQPTAKGSIPVVNSLNAKAIGGTNQAFEMSASDTEATMTAGGETGTEALLTGKSCSQQDMTNTSQMQSTQGLSSENGQSDEAFRVKTSAGEQQSVADNQGMATSKPINIESNVQVKEPLQSAETAKSELYNQVAKAVTANLQGKGPMEFKLQLQPQDMGLIDIKLSLEGGKLTIDILAANAKTHALLAGQTDKLIQGLGLQNVQVENVQVGRDAADMGSQGQHQSGTGSGNADLFRENNREFVNRDGDNVDYADRAGLESEEEPARAAFDAQSMYRLNYAV